MKKPKYLVLFVLVLGLLLTTSVIPKLWAVAGLYNETIRIVNSTGTVQDPGTASATSANYNETVRVVNSSGLVVDTFGGAPTNSSALQQPIALVGASINNFISATTTTGTINTPTGTINGDLELVFITLNNATSSAFTPPAGWTVVTGCDGTGNAQGNGGTIVAFKHIASSEGATIAAFTWTTNGTGITWAESYRNAAFDTCTSANTTAATTFNAPAITAAANTDRIVAVVTQPAANSGIYIAAASQPVNLQQTQFYNGASTSNAAVNYPATSTSVTALTFTGASQAWVGLQMGLSFSTSTTAGPQGALTYNQADSYLGALWLGATSLAQWADATFNSGKFSLILPDCSAIGAPLGTTLAGASKLGPILGECGGNLYLGNANLGSNITALSALKVAANNITTTSGSINTSTGQMGTTGGGIISTTGGAAPTVTCSGGSTGTSVTAGSTNNRGSIVSSSSASTNCTITWSAAATWPQAPFCSFFDAGASITPTTYSTGACGTSTCIVDFASTTSKTIGYICM